MKKLIYIFLSFLILLFFFWHALWNYDKIGLGDWDSELSHYYIHMKSLFGYQQVLLWDPWICGGKNGFAITGLKEFGLTILMSSFLPFLLAIKLSLLFHFLFAFLGFYLFNTKVVENKNILPPLIISSLFVLNGSMIKHLEEGHLVFLPICLFPLLFTVLEVGLKEKKISYAILASFLMASFFYSGTTYPLVHLFSLLVVYFLFKFIFSPGKKYFIVFCGTFALISLSLSSAKILLAYDHLSQFNIVRSYAASEYFPLYGIWQSFISPIPHSIGKWGWHERSFYIGSTGVFLLGFGLFILFPLRLIKRKTILTEVIFLLTAVLSFFMIIGAYSPNSLYTLSYSLPIFKSMQVTGRWFFPFIFSSCIFLLFTLKELESLPTPNKLKKILPFGHFFLIGICSSLLYELYQANHQPIKNFSHNKLSWTEKLDERAKSPLYKNDFSIIENPSVYDYGARSSMLPMVIKNESSRECYSPLSRSQKTITMGEDIVYLLNPSKLSKISNIEFSPNKITFDAQITKSEVLILNQNYSAYWYTKGHTVTQIEGKPALLLKEGNYKGLSFYFWPKYLTMSLFLIFLGLFFSSVLLWSERKKATALDNKL